MKALLDKPMSSHEASVRLPNSAFHIEQKQKPWVVSHWGSKNKNKQQTIKQTSRQAERSRSGKRSTQTDTQTHAHTHTDIQTQTYRQTDIQTDTRTHRQRHRHLNISLGDETHMDLTLLCEGDSGRGRKEECDGSQVHHEHDMVPKKINPQVMVTPGSKPLTLHAAEAREHRQTKTDRQTHTQTHCVCTFVFHLCLFKNILGRTTLFYCHPYTVIDWPVPRLRGVLAFLWQEAVVHLAHCHMQL